MVRLDTNTFLCQLCETFVRIQARFRGRRRVIVPRLIGVERQSERPEFGGINPRDCERRLVGQCRRGMPGLDLVTEDETNGGMLFLESRKEVLDGLMGHVWERRTLQSLSIIILLQGQT